MRIFNVEIQKFLCITDTKLLWLWVLVHRISLLHWKSGEMNIQGLIPVKLLEEEFWNIHKWAICALFNSLFDFDGSGTGLRSNLYLWMLDSSLIITAIIFNVLCPVCIAEVTIWLLLTLLTVIVRSEEVILIAETMSAWWLICRKKLSLNFAGTKNVRMMINRKTSIGLTMDITFQICCLVLITLISLYLCS